MADLVPPPAFTPQAKRIIVGATMAAYDAALRITPYPSALFQRMKSPEPGDLVVEWSTAYRRLYDSDDSYEAWAGHCLTYVDDVREQVVSDPDDEPWWDTFGVCLNPDGTEYRWTNHELLAVPTVMVGGWAQR